MTVTEMLIARVVSFVVTVPQRAAAAYRRLRQQDGQTVAEYALVLLVAAAIAVAFLIWAKQSGKLDDFFDAIFSKLLNSVDSEPTPDP